jgi:anaerobic ribonucleoside-triphosphate reductase activating protein
LPADILAAPSLIEAPTEGKALKVGGLVAFTATDYPGQLAAAVFVQGCPWRCGYCHNPHLQARGAETPMAWGQVMRLLRRRVGLIDAVVFSGGEPTIDPALADAMREVRALGFLVGLHTAGMYTRRLVEVLPLLDWVGFDVKATPDGYDRVTRIAGSAAPAMDSARAVLASGVACEFRSTVHPALHKPDDLLRLAQSLSAMGVRDYVLQRFRRTGCADAQLNAADTTGSITPELLARIAALFERFSVRSE